MQYKCLIHSFKHDTNTVDLRAVKHICTTNVIFSLPERGCGEGITRGINPLNRDQTHHI